MYAWPKFHGSSSNSFRENDLNTKKFTPPPTTTTTTTTTPEKQYICLASASQARQKRLRTIWKSQPCPIPSHTRVEGQSHSSAISCPVPMEGGLGYKWQVRFWSIKSRFYEGANFNRIIVFASKNKYAPFPEQSDIPLSYIHITRLFRYLSIATNLQLTL